MFFLCPFPDACLGENECVEGHTGVRCKECIPGYYQQRSGSVSKRRKTPSGGVKSEVKSSLCQAYGEDSKNGLLYIILVPARIVVVG